MEKIKKAWLEKFNEIDTTPIEEATRKMWRELNKQLDDLFVEGLKRKGFEFAGKWELEQFVKGRCRCEDNITFKEKTYFVDDIPFFVHFYETTTDMPYDFNENKVIMTASLGKYRFL